MGTRRKTALALAATIAGTCLAGSIALAAEGERLRADMDGQQENPDADPDGSGDAKVDVVVDVEDGRVCFDLHFRDVGTPNRGHIHRGAVDANGGIVVPFFDIQTTASTADPRHDDLEDGKFDDCVAVADEALLAEIAEFPERFYVNLHNARFPGGAIRGQLHD